MPAAATPPEAHKSVAELLAQRTAVEKQLADAELPILNELKALLESPAIATAIAKARELQARLGAGNTSAIVGHFISAYASARQTIPDDIHRHERTKAIP